jgi:lysophospholipase L1-like esterase
MNRGRPLKIAKRLLFALVVVCLALAGGEIGVRLAGVAVDTGEAIKSDRLFYHPFARDPVPGDEYTTLGVKVYLVTPGPYNVEAPLTSKPPGTTRVVCLGDSSTFGAEVRRDQAYPQVLQRVLRLCYPAKNVEVWNFGKHGYTSYQGRLLIESVWDRARPDVLTFYFGVNDAVFAPIRPDKEWQDVPRWGLRLHRSLYGRSRLYALLRDVNLNYLQRCVRHPFGATPPAPGITRFRVSRDDFWRNHEAVRQRVSAAGGVMLTLSAAGLIGEEIAPGPYFVDWQPGPDDIDLARLLGDERRAGRDPLADVVHPNAHGHRVIARAVLDKLAVKWGPPACEVMEVMATEAKRDRPQQPGVR